MQGEKGLFPGGFYSGYNWVTYISNNYSTTRIQDLIISDSNIAQLGLTSARVSSKSELWNMVLIDSEDNT